MTARKNHVNRIVKQAVGNLKDKNRKKAEIEKVIQSIVECFEIQTGCKVVNKDQFFLKIEKVK